MGFGVLLFVGEREIKKRYNTDEKKERRKKKEGEKKIVHHFIYGDTNPVI